MNLARRANNTGLAIKAIAGLLRNSENERSLSGKPLLNPRETEALLMGIQVMSYDLYAVAESALEAQEATE